jgi:hypothetical protein
MGACVRNRMGYHVFKWTFSPFRKGEKVRQAVIHSVAFRGLGNSKLNCNVRSSAYPAYMPATVREQLAHFPNLMGIACMCVCRPALLLWLP